MTSAEKECASGEEENEEPVCRLSLPTDPHTLCRRTNIKPSAICFAGSGREEMTFGDTFYYYCTKCDVEFHESCYLWPWKMTHPYHPQHTLTFSVRNPESGIIHDSNIHSCTDDKFIGVGIPEIGKFFDNCTWCEGNLKHDKFFYRCSICNFCLDLSCSQNFPLLIITNPKSHHHSLIFLLQPLLRPCDACGLVNTFDPGYACFQCNYLVHKSCIDLPRVIKITRHRHPLFYTPFLSTHSYCRLCYETVDIKYGHYSCNHDDCFYVVHSKCATHKNVWDGRELEWETEETGKTEDVRPFKRVGGNLINHFSHEHHLKLVKYDCVQDADKQCQACVLHIHDRDFFTCVQCDFFLHEVCASLPRQVEHTSHKHPLFLDPVPQVEYGSLLCYLCSRVFSGFRYKCSMNSCKDSNGREFQIDVRCVLVPESFVHKGHTHSLFIPSSIGNPISLCGGCKTNAYCYLQCTVCEYVLCFKCATIPDELRYEYEILPLSLCYGEDSDEKNWCEVCEEELDPIQWFYTCNKRYIKIHLNCVFGSSAYMKPGHMFQDGSLSVEVFCNSDSTRPFCHKCDSRCSSSVYFKLCDEKIICSFGCLGNVSGRL